MNKSEILGTMVAASLMLLGMALWSNAVTYGLGILCFVALGVCIIALVAYLAKQFYDAVVDGVSWTE